MKSCRILIWILEEFCCMYPKISQLEKLKYSYAGGKWCLVFFKFSIAIFMLLKNFDEIKSNDCKRKWFLVESSRILEESIYQNSDWKKQIFLTIWPLMNPDIKLFKYLFNFNPYFSRLSDKTPAMKKLNNLSCGYTQL